MSKSCFKMFKIFEPCYENMLYGNIFILFIGDEKITFDEYKAFMEMTEGRMGTPEEQEEKLIEAFKVFDKDGR